MPMVVLDWTIGVWCGWLSMPLWADDWVYWDVRGRFCLSPREFKGLDDLGGIWLRSGGKSSELLGKYEPWLAL